MSDERDDLLKEIGDALRIEPSPSFAAGVRTRIANEPASRRAWMTWFMWGGAASAVATMVAVFAMSRPVERAEPMPTTTPVVAGTATVVAHPPSSETATPRPIAETATLAAVVPREPKLPRPVATKSVEVVFPTDERRALDGLLRNLRLGRAFVPPAPSLTDPITGELLPLPPVEIPPIFPDEDGTGRVRTGRPR